MSTKIKKLLLIVSFVMIMAMAFSFSVFAAEKDAVGDLNRDGVKDENDAIYLLNNYIFGENNIDQPSDYNGDGKIDEDDAIFLLNNIIFGDLLDTFHICDHPESWELVKTVAPTCKEGGYTVVKCKCGKEAKILPTEKTDNHNFDWEHPDLTHQANCLNNGYISAACTVCGENDVIQQNATGEHTWKGGDCETDAQCTDCGTVLPTTGHIYPATPTFVKEATCEGGYKEYKCTNNGCDSVHREDLAPTDHRFADGAWEIVRLDAVEGKKCTFVYVEEAVCEDCGKTVERTTQEVEKHTEVTAVTPATCVTPGEKTISCSECGEVLLVSEMPVPENDSARAHKFDEGVTVGSVTTFTCQNEGCGKTKTTVKASEDGKVDLKDAEEVELEGGAAIIPDDNIKNELGDKEVSISIEEVKAEDLDNLGAEDKELLKELGDAPVFDLNLIAGDEKVTNFSGTMTVRLPYTLEEGEDPDCITIWYIGDDGHIDRMEAKYVDGYAVFETNHFSYYTVTRMTPAERCEYYGSHNNQTTTVPATCVTGGYTLTICTRCGHKEISNEVSAIGHIWDTKTTQPTCTAAGSVVYDCKACDVSYTEVIRATGHNVKEVTDEYKKPSCSAKGEKVYKCENENCSYSYKEELPQEEHDYKKTVFAPDCENGGYTLNDCKNCDSSFTSDSTKALGHDFADGVCGTCGNQCEHDYQYGVCVICDHVKEKPVQPDPDEPDPDVPTPEDPDCKHKLTFTYEFISEAMKSCQYGVVITESCTKCSYTDTYTVYECIELKFEVDISDYDTCGKHDFTYIACPCGNISDFIGDVHFDKELSDNEFACSECDLRAVENTEKSTDGCVLAYTQTVTLYFGDEVAEVITMTHYDLTHTFEDKEFTFENGGDCEKGVNVKVTCSECGESAEYKLYEHRMVGEAEFDFIKYGCCESHHFVINSCPCGKESYAEFWGFNLILGEDDYYSYCGCKECGVIIKQHSETVVGDCIYYYLYEYVIVLDDEPIFFFECLDTVYNHDFEITVEKLGDECSDGLIATYVCKSCGLSYTETMNDHLIEESYLDLSGYGFCEYHKIVIVKCIVCDYVASIWTEDLPCQKTEEGYEYFCKECPIRMVEVETIGKKDDRCWCPVTIITTLYNGEEFILTVTQKGGTFDHEYETTYELFGTTCKDGVLIIHTCKDCGSFQTEMIYGHNYDHINIDLTEHNACANHILFVQICTVCNGFFYYEPIDFEVSYTENGVIYYCNHCDVAITEATVYGEKDENCCINTVHALVVSVGNNEICRFENIESKYSHNNKVTYEMLGETCYDGIIITYTCTDCGETYTNKYYGHVYESTELDLGQYGACEYHTVYVNECVCCGTVESIKIDGFDIQSEEDGETYFCRECEVSIRFTKSIGDRGENCEVITTYTYVVYANKEEVDRYQSTVTENLHEYEEKVEFLGESCDDGVIVTYTCKHCEDGYRSEYSDHNITYFEMIISEDGACGNHRLWAYKCEWCDYCEDINLHGGEVSYNETSNGYKAHCFMCGLELVATQTRGEKDENCMVEVLLSYSLCFKDKVLFTAKQTGLSEDHNMKVTVTFNDPELGCDGGYIVSEKCSDCGNGGEWSDVGHTLLIKDVYYFADHGHECGNGMITIRSCPCGKETSFSMEVDGFEIVERSEKINGVWHEIFACICPNCKYEMVSDQYTVKDQYCTTTLYRVVTLGETTVTSSTDWGTSHSESEKVLPDESYTKENADGTTVTVTAKEIYCSDCFASLEKIVTTETFDADGNCISRLTENFAYKALGEGANETVAEIESSNLREYIIVNLSGETYSFVLSVVDTDYVGGEVISVERKDYEYKDGNYCSYTIIYTHSDGSTRTETVTNHSSQTWKYVLSNGSTSCMDGLDRVWYCTVCQTETDREENAYSGEHYLNKGETGVFVESIDLAQYGAVCGGTLDIYSCPCGYKKSAKVNLNCDHVNSSNSIYHVEKDGVNHRYVLYACAVSNCGFKLVEEDWHSFDENCNEISNYRYLFGLNATNTEYLDTYEFSYQTGNSKHAGSKTTVTVTEDRYYAVTACEKCGMLESTEEIVNGICTKIQYTYDKNENLIGKLIRETLVIGSDSSEDILFLDRSEEYNENGDLVWFYQTEYTYPEAKNGNYCVRTRTTSSSASGMHNTETEETHQWSWYGAYCTPTEVVMTCMRCKETKTEVYYVQGHNFYYDVEKGCYVCHWCELESAVGANGLVGFEDKTLTLGDGTKYVIAWYNDYGESYIWDIVLINTATGEMYPLDDIRPEILNDYTLTLDALAISKIAKELGISDCGYMIRLAFVPTDANGELDYAITLDPHVYSLEDKTLSENACEAVSTYKCIFCGDIYEKTQKGHYFSETDGKKTIMHGEDGTVTITESTLYVCDICGQTRTDSFVRVYGANGKVLKQAENYNYAELNSFESTYTYDYEEGTYTVVKVASRYTSTNKYTIVGEKHLSSKEEYVEDGRVEETVYDYDNGTMTRTFSYSDGSKQITVLTIEDNRVISQENTYSDGSKDSCTYTYDFENDTLTKVQVHSDGTTDTQITCLSDGRMISQYYEYADGSWQNQKYTYDFENGTCTITETGSGGSTSISVYTYPGMDMISSQTNYVDGTWQKSERVVTDKEIIVTITNSSGEVTIDTYDVHTRMWLTSESRNVDGYYYIKRYFTNLEIGITFASTIEKRTEEGDEYVEMYEYFNDVVCITSCVVRLADETEIIKVYSYDFDNDICTETCTENGEVTVTKTRISTGEIVE